MINMNDVDCIGYGPRARRRRRMRDVLIGDVYSLCRSRNHFGFCDWCGNEAYLEGSASNALCSSMICRTCSRDRRNIVSRDRRDERIRRAIARALDRIR